MRREGLAAALGQHWLEFIESQNIPSWKGHTRIRVQSLDTPKITACASSGVGSLGLLALTVTLPLN